MGSPNFNTSSDILLNLATKESDRDDQDYCDDIAEIRTEIESELQKLQRLDFYKVQIESGYHQGFQVMLLTDMSDTYIQDCINDLEKYKECYRPDGYVFEMQDLQFSTANAVNVTRYNLERTIIREYKYIHNELLRIAKEYGLGEVHGQTWTSSVGDITTKRI